MPRLKRIMGIVLVVLGLLFITINPLAQSDNANVAAGLTFFSAGLLLLSKRKRKGVSDDSKANDAPN
jgi:LPXTG-motif cell wall-anchored protein